jgi:hypothetical protein
LTLGQSEGSVQVGLEQGGLLDSGQQTGIDGLLVSNAAGIDSLLLLI